MRVDCIELDETPQEEPVERPLSRVEKDAVFLSLQGGSVIDWTGLSFQSREEVGQFLRLWHLDPEGPLWARERLRYVYNQAVEFLEEHLHLSLLPEVRRPNAIEDAFLAASVGGGFRRRRVQFCTILKLMHVINHLEMQELRNVSPIREVDLLEEAGRVVLEKAEEMRMAGLKVTAFYGNRKTRPSLITKLLAKREATAAPIFDKLRFRILTEHREDLVPALSWLLSNLIPFPALVPGESHNNLLNEDEVLAATEAAPELGRLLRRAPLPVAVNAHSGVQYRSINFVAALPISVEGLKGVELSANRALLGVSVPVLAEFQLLDQMTDFTNEQGDGCHDRYKARQMEKVYERLGRTPPRASADAKRG